MTAKQKTLDLLRAQRADRNAGRHAERVGEWQGALDRLADRVEGWTAEAAGGGLLSVERSAVPRREPVLGEYDATRVVLAAPNGEEVRFEPVATRVLGADGRVDVLGPRGDRKLVWEQAGDSWRFADFAGREWAFDPLDESTFWETVGEMLTPPAPSGA